MDISEIRKKAKSREEQKKSGEKPEGPETISGSENQIEEHGNRDSIEIHGQVPPATDNQQQFPEHIHEQAPALSRSMPEIISEQRSEEIELLTFTLAHEEFAFRVAEVEEIVRFQKITRVPTMAKYVLGITSLRGKIIPVLDLKVRLGLRNETMDIGSHHTDAEGESLSLGTFEKILIVDGPKGPIGATIDKIADVVRIPADQVLDPPGHLSDVELKYIEGVVIADKRFISVIRAEATMNIEVS